MRAALLTVKRDAVLPWVIVGYGVLLFLGPSPELVLPFFALRIFHVSPTQPGLLFSAVGLGTILGSLVVASSGEASSKGRLFLLSLLVWSASLLLFALCQRFWLAALALLLVSITQNVVGALTITLLQLCVPPQMRGRMMGLRTLLHMGVRPLGDFFASGLLAALGGPVTVVLCAAIVGLYSLSLLSRASQRSF